MLHFRTVEPKTLELLKEIQKIPEFKDLRLVGGTGLSLQYGHRKSVDIDLFGKTSIDTDELAFLLEKIGKVEKLSLSKTINIFTVDNIKVDIVNYPYKWLDNPLIADNIKIASDVDIAAMKLSAITNRGTKKDFVDLFYLLKVFSIKDMLRFYSKKYNDGNVFLVLKSLVYFDEAEPEPMPYMFEQFSWQDIKDKIRFVVTKYNNI
jgi:hypothetical protein